MTDKAESTGMEVQDILDQLVINAHNHSVAGDSSDFTLREIEAALRRLHTLLMALPELQDLPPDIEGRKIGEKDGRIIYEPAYSLRVLSINEGRRQARKALSDLFGEGR